MLWIASASAFSINSSRSSLSRSVSSMFIHALHRDGSPSHLSLSPRGQDWTALSSNEFGRESAPFVFGGLAMMLRKHSLVLVTLVSLVLLASSCEKPGVHAAGEDSTAVPIQKILSVDEEQLL